MKKELVEKNITLSMEFRRYVIEHPKVAEQIPKGAQVVLLPQDDPELCREHLKLAEWHKEQGQIVVSVRVEKLASARRSGWVRPRVEALSG